MSDANFITQAANSRQAIAEMLEDNERMREALEETLWFLEKKFDDPSRLKDTEVYKRAKQALKGTENV